MSAYPDFGPFPWNFSARASTAQAEPRAVVMRATPESGPPRQVTVGTHAQVYRQIGFTNPYDRPMRLGINAAHMTDAGLRRGAQTTIEMRSPSGLVIGTHSRTLHMTQFVLQPFERISGIGGVVVDPPVGYDPLDMTTKITNISAESAQWMLAAPWNPDPNEGPPWPTYSLGLLYLPCTITSNIHDVDLDTGEEVFVRNQQIIDGIFGITIE
jgi:hypothetical protein